MLSFDCVIVPYDINGILLLPALYFFLDMCLSPHVVHKGKQETSGGETHYDSRTEFNHENHKIREAMD